MYKYLVVGCGGSGGATLAYMMDQITSELLPHGIARIPEGMQFVHIDVPAAADTRQPGVGSIAEQGGTYIGTAPSAGSYPVLDNALSGHLAANDALDEIATWAPRRPESIGIPITDGAGQMRSVGRAITLSGLREVRSGLRSAVEALNTVEADSAMAALARAVPGTGRFDVAAGVVTIVVSSMAGGAGASMALDVCRLLADIPGIDPGRVGIFMAAPDIFDKLPESARGGTRANALAMLGEIVAAQTGAAHPHDQRILDALGQRLSSNVRAPFARVFPVGRKVGAEQTVFGDGTQTAVYRGLGRGLAALALSGRASSDFVTFDLANTLGAEDGADQSLFGWGVDPGRLAWGAFGFGSLSLGRDRYRHYAAQRIARTAMDRLTDGHLQPGSTALGTEQLRSLLDSQWPGVAPAAGLPRQAAFGVLTKEEFSAWVTDVMLPRDLVDQDVRGQVDTLVRPGMPQATGQAQQWLAPVRSFLGAQRGALASATEQAAMRWAYGWSHRLHDGVLAEVEGAVSRFGLAYARALVERMETTISDSLIPQLESRARSAAPDLGSLPPELEAEVGRIRGAIVNGQAIVEKLVQTVTSSLASNRYGRSCSIAAEVLRSFVASSLRPLAASLSESLQLTEQAMAPGSNALGPGVANVQTDRYPAWPSDADARVPDRFDVADNDILITPSAEFADRYVAHLRTAVMVGTARPTFDDARATVARSVISGQWPVAAGESAPGGLVSVLAAWRAPIFLTDPDTGTSLVPSQGRYAWHLRTGEVLDRAQKFVRQRDGSFERYCSQSLSDYVAAQDDPTARAARLVDVVDKFGQAVRRAMPLISVDSDAVQAVHGKGIEYFFKFSTVPFADEPELVESIRRALQGMRNIAVDVVESNGVLTRALATDRDANRIDIFGSYRNYAPIVFSGLLDPIKDQWEALPTFGRRQFWANRRARPLPASLPMGDQERRAMVAGWYVGQLVGELRIPEAPYSDPVQIWDDETGRWRAFPSPLLTPPADFVGKSFDWLPAVLESVLIAILRSHEPPAMDSTKPYRLLRGLADDTAMGPRSGLLELSAVQRFGAWLSTGTTRSGAPGRVSGATPAERLEAAKKWLESIREFTGRNYLRVGQDGAPGGGEFSSITRRDRASATPIFHDLALDIHVVTKDLQGALDEAATIRTTPPVAGLAEPAPGFGSF